MDAVFISLWSGIADGICKVVWFCMIDRLSANNFLCILFISYLAQILKNYSGFRFLISEIDTLFSILYNTL